jgi:hypothetical protein
MLTALQAANGNCERLSKELRASEAKAVDLDRVRPGCSCIVHVDIEQWLVSRLPPGELSETVPRGGHVTNERRRIPNGA